MLTSEKDTYIKLLEDFKRVTVSCNHGWTMEQIEAIKAIESFEDDLECNQEIRLNLYKEN